jgi:hypothetical protein
MFGDGKSTWDMRDWVMFTRGGTSHFRWRATSISGSLPATLSAMPSARISSCERRNGDGRVYGDVVMARLKSGRCWRHGQSTYHRTGSSGSIATTRCKTNWNHFVGACNAAARSARRSGKRKLRNDWAWNRPIGRPVAGEKLASIKMSLLSKIARVEPPSHIANIGPVPFSRKAVFILTETRLPQCREHSVSPLSSFSLSRKLDAVLNEVGNGFASYLSARKFA